MNSLPSRSNQQEMISMEGKRAILGRRSRLIVFSPLSISSHGPFFTKKSERKKDEQVGKYQFGHCLPTSSSDGNLFASTVIITR